MKGPYLAAQCFRAGHSRYMSSLPAGRTVSLVVHLGGELINSTGLPRVHDQRKTHNHKARAEPNPKRRKETSPPVFAPHLAPKIVPLVAPFKCGFNGHSVSPVAIGK